MRTILSTALTTLVGTVFLAGRAQADITCTRFGAATFRVGSMLKFQWNDTQSTSIETFSLDLYCVQNNKLLQNLETLNLTSPSPFPWVANSSITAFSADCPLNQFQGGFSWTFNDYETGALQVGVSKCNVMLLVGTNNGPNGPASGGNANEGDNEPLDEDPKPTEIVITSKTKTIVIGVGCAVGALVLAGFIGFYFIRYSNRRAEKEHSARKLREPIQTGPLFSPMSRPNGSNGGSGGNGTGGNSRYNELSSVTTDSLGTGSPTTTAKTEMVDMGGYNSAKMTPISAAHGLPASRVASPSLISRSTTPTPVAAPHAPPSRAASPVPGSPTPIAAMHAKMASPALASASWAVNGSTGHGEPRPSSLLTSPFIPAEDTSTNGQNPFEQRQYGH